MTMMPKPKQSLFATQWQLNRLARLRYRGFWQWMLKLGDSVPQNSDKPPLHALIRRRGESWLRENVSGLHGVRLVHRTECKQPTDAPENLKPLIHRAQAAILNALMQLLQLGDSFGICHLAMGSVSWANVVRRTKLWTNQIRPQFLWGFLEEEPVGAY